MKLLLARGVRAQLCTHAERSVPHECCGALIGRGDVVEQVLPLENEAQMPRVAFSLSAKSYLLAERAAEEAGATVLGFYHSHVDAPATPSKVDYAFARREFVTLIIEVHAASARDVKAFRLIEDAFVALTLEEP